MIINVAMTHGADGRKNNVSEHIALVYSGEDYFFRLKRMIDDAQSTIHLQTYIFQNDSIGIKIGNALKEAALRNVKVYVLLDAYGSSSLANAFTKDLIQHGIHFRFFAPFFSANNIYIGRRLHHKVVVVDGKIALIGGINIADKYLGTRTEAPWLDYAVQVEGKIGAQLEKLCSNIYFQRNRIQRKNRKPLFHLTGSGVHIIQNDWLKQKSEISDAYIKAIRNAKKEVIIVGSYFLPGKKLTHALKNASGKGVKIKIVLSGVSDITVSKRASSYLYSSFLKHNIELYEWNKSVLHGKMAVADNKWVTIGSFNLNHLSSYGSIEMNVEIHSAKFSATFSSHLNEVIAQCEQITVENFEERNGLFTKLINWLSYHFVRIGMIIITYISYKRFLIRYQNE